MSSRTNNDKDEDNSPKTLNDKISTIVDYLIQNPLYTYTLNIYMIWFGWALWHINNCWLFNAKSSLYIYIKYI